MKPGNVLAVARETSGQPVVFADRWDNPGGGVPGDGTMMIEELLRHPDVPSAVGVLWDPIAVESAAQQVGAQSSGCASAARRRRSRAARSTRTW